MAVDALHVELFYTPPLPIPDTSTEYCGLFCLWHNQETERHSTIRTFLNVGMAHTEFLTMMARMTALEETPIPAALVQKLWEWYDANRQIPYAVGNAVRHLHMVVE